MLFNHPDYDDHEKVLFYSDPSTKLKSIIAIHNTSLGPALGGCRIYNYKNEDDALTDVLKLSKSMSYKAAIADLSVGGGKSVIITTCKTDDMIQSFGKNINFLNGQYIVAEDVGSTEHDMDIIKKETSFVGGTSEEGDPSDATAYGVFRSICAISHYLWKKKPLKGITVAVQGVGNVGNKLCKYLRNAGAIVYVSDTSRKALNNVYYNYGCIEVDIHKIHKLDVDIFSPCAMGGSLTKTSILEMKAKAVVGSANNQLYNNKCIQELVINNILYIPDYVVNAGGLIHISNTKDGLNTKEIKNNLDKIFNRVLNFCESGKGNSLSIFNEVEQMAKDKLKV